MRIISFGWTWPAIVAREKFVTRRDWKEPYAITFREGERLTAYDRSQRVGGKPIAMIELTDDVHCEPDAHAPDSDFAEEGFAWLAAHPELLPAGAGEHGRVTLTRAAFDRWRQDGGSSWVVRFRIVDVYRPLDQLLRIG